MHPMYTRIIPHYYVMFTELNLHAPAGAACNQTIQMHLTCSELNKKPCFVANCKRRQILALSLKSAGSLPIPTSYIYVCQMCRDISYIHSKRFEILKKLCRMSESYTCRNYASYISK